MPYLLKQIVIFLIFAAFLSSQALAGEKILPKPKPTVIKEIKEKTADKKNLYPQKKTSKKKRKERS